MSRTGARMILLVVFAAFVVSIGAAIIGDYRARLSNIERLHAELAQHNAIAANHVDIAARAKNLERRAGAEGAGNRPTIADLQARVQSIVERFGGQISRVQVLAADATGEISGPGLRVSFSTGIAGLRDSLHALEFGTPPLRLDGLSARARDVRAAGTINPLDVRIDVQLIDGG